jgi:hypothetical protein
VEGSGNEGDRLMSAMRCDAMVRGTGSQDLG